MVRAQQWADLEFDSFLVGLEGRTEVSRAKSEAKMQRIQASYYGDAAKSAGRAVKLGATAAILGGFGTMGMFGGGTPAGAGFAGWGRRVVS